MTKREHGCLWMRKTETKNYDNLFILVTFLLDNALILDREIHAKIDLLDHSPCFCTGSFSWEDGPVIKVSEAFLDETEKSLDIRLLCGDQWELHRLFPLERLACHQGIGGLSRWNRKTTGHKITVTLWILSMRVTGRTQGEPAKCYCIIPLLLQLINNSSSMNNEHHKGDGGLESWSWIFLVILFLHYFSPNITACLRRHSVSNTSSSVFHQDV